MIDCQRFFNLKSSNQRIITHKDLLWAQNLTSLVMIFWLKNFTSVSFFLINSIIHFVDDKTILNFINNQIIRNLNHPIVFII